MRAVVLRGPQDLLVADVDAPVAGPGEVLVRIKVTGICGSDLARVLAGAAHTYPIVLGHEFSGVVEAVGPGVHRVGPGERVVGVPLQPCHRCADCARGDFGQCSRYSFVGSRTQGAWADLVVVPEANVIAFDDGVSFEEAAMVEPATVALHALRKVGPLTGRDVAIVGAGTIGLFALQWARLLGAARTCVFDIDEERLVTARALGADDAIDPRAQDARTRWREATGDRGYPVVVETAGAPDAMRQSFDLVAKKGAVVFVGTPLEDVTFGHKEFELLNRKEFSLTGSWMSYSGPFPGDEWALALHHIRQGGLTCNDLVDRRFALDEVQAAFDLYLRGEPVHGKILLHTTDGGHLDGRAEAVEPRRQRAHAGERP